MDLYMVCIFATLEIQPGLLAKAKGGAPHKAANSADVDETLIY